MTTMKPVTSTCESRFVEQIILIGKHLDGRSLHEGRVIELAFGNDGCCIVVLGSTRVLAQVSCELSEPKPSRPAEGALYVNFELSPMAAPNFKSGRMSDAGVEASRLLERCIRDSKCIDLESLCVVAGSKVWVIRVDVQALNDDGNLIECASVATIAALAHFKRPHVAVVGNDVTIHSLDDHEPSPLTLHHMPVIVNLALFDEGNVVLVDPLEIEERILPGKIFIGVNAHQEICSLHISGSIMIKKHTVLKCSHIAVKRAQVLTQKIRTALDDDRYKKATNQVTGFVTLLKTGTILGAIQPMKQMIMPHELTEYYVEDITEIPKENPKTKPHFKIKASRTKENVQEFLRTTETAIFEGGRSQWSMEDEEDDHDDGSDSSEEIVRDYVKTNIPAIAASEAGSGDEEVILKPEHVDVKKNSASSRGWYSKEAFE